MKVYLVCILDSDHYCEPEFYFFKTANSARKYIENLILSDLQKERNFSPGETRISRLYHDDDCSNDQIMRIDYSVGAEGFYVHTIHEIEIKNGDYLCIFHHAYDGVGFRVEKIGTLEECQEQMKKSATQSVELYCVDMKLDNIDFFNITDRNSCVDIDTEWHMCDVIQFKADEIMQGEEKKPKE